jgi:hypothetical protein
MAIYPVQGVTSGFATLISVPCRLRVKAVFYVGGVLCIDRLAMGGVCRSLLGNQCEGGIRFNSRSGPVMVSSPRRAA